MKGLSRSVIATLGAAAIAAGLTACGDSKTTTAASGSSTGASGTVTLRVGYVTTPQHPYGIAIDAFTKEVASASGGKMAVEAIPNYTGGDAKLLDDVSGGTVEMAAVSTAVWDTKGVNVFQALQAPFLITNYPLDASIIGGPVGTAMLSSPNGPAKLNLVGLGILEGGLRKPVGAKEPLTSPASFVGKKIRAPQSKVLAAGITALGASPVALPVGDVYSALQNGTVDGMEANLGLISTNKYNEVAKFVTQNVNLWPFPAALVINKDQFDKLSADQKSVIQTAGGHLATNSINVFLNPPAGATNFVTDLCGKGLTFAFASDADRVALAKAEVPTYRQLEADPEVAGFIKQIQDAKAAAPPPAAPPPLPAGCKKV